MGGGVGGSFSEAGNMGGMEGEESMNSVLDMLQLKCLGTLKWRCRLC